MTDYIPKVGINGFGRIGKLVLKAAFNSPGKIEIVAINNPSTGIDQIPYALKYDTVHGRWDKDVQIISENEITIDGKRIKVFNNRNPSELNWKDENVEWVVEATGMFNDKVKAEKHIHANGAQNVMISAPSPDAPMYVMGVNNEHYNPSECVISNASCTTNCLSPMAKVLDDAFGIEEGIVTTVHAMTAKQKAVDSPAKGNSWRDSRCGSGNIIPASTGAAKAVAKVIPSLQGRLTGMAFRVPTYDVSVVDFTVRVKTATSLQEICQVMKKASESEKLKGILGYTNEPLVSSDFFGDTHSSIFDESASMSLNEKFFKLISWYDNEYGYSMRCVDLVAFCARKKHAAE